MSEQVMGLTADESGIARAVKIAQEKAANDSQFTGKSGQGWLARRLGVTQQAVSSWLRRGWAPTNRADEIQQLVGVPARELLNPRLVKMLGSKVAA